jgi:nicotinate-nucleotide adenylyltransferase
MTKRIGIFSGAFDPVHAGHISFALEAIKKAQLDKVYLLVEPKPRHKPSVSHIAHRIAMAKLALAPYKNMHVLQFPDQQFSVAKTLPRLKKRFSHDRLVLLIGSDLIVYIHEWPLINRLLAQVDLVIAIRHDAKATTVNQLISDLPVIPKDVSIIQAPLPLASSGHVRQATKQNNFAIETLPSLKAYIRDKWLYVSPSDSSSRSSS